jgi:putative ABC transport system permease protein
MFGYYLKTAIRNLRKNSRFFVINVTGFAFGISICLTIALFLAKEYSYDRFHEHAGQIVRLIDTKDNSSEIDYRVKDILQNHYPEIENACLSLRSAHPLEVKCGDKGFYLDDIMSVDNDFFEVFSVPFIAGNPSLPFTNIHSVIITESTAKTLFGTENPLGKDLFVWGEVPTTISGVIKDFPDNSSISAGLLVNADNDRFKLSTWMEDSRDLSTYRWPFQIYFQLSKNADPDQLVARINAQNDLLKPYNEQVGFLKLKDIYLHDPTSGSDTKQGNPGLLKLLTGIAFIILALAVINYINLTVAQQNKRNKDTGVKKTIGATRVHILSQFLSESVLVTFLAFILGVLLAWIFLPFTRSVLNTNLDFSLLFHWPYFPILLGSILLIGLISGSGPAIILSGIGILGLAIFSSERRTKEIGVRKVNGAKVSEILAMLNRDFVKWVAIAFVIATPIAYYAMHKWLENFAYKTELNWWIFALAGLLALGIALLTVSWQSWKAATRNPVEALRYE